MTEQDNSEDSRALDADVLKELHEYSISLDHDIIYLESAPDSEDADEVNWLMARRFQKNIQALVLGGAEAVTVDINCPGGHCWHGMAIYDAIKMCPVKVTGIVSGEASSMASVILQACCERLVMPNAMVMYHPGATEICTSTPEFKSAVNAEMKLNDKIDAIMYERAKAKNPKMTAEEFDILQMRGLYLHSDAAVAFGFADKVLAYPKKKT